ncbi:MAG TPA: hypothetical protein VKY65_07285 [Alphaproteobacteria bacterium]|nr:hypothetical protein [Alphaproteobacteria bacterium]
MATGGTQRDRAGSDRAGSARHAPSPRKRVVANDNIRPRRGGVLRLLAAAAVVALLALAAALWAGLLP